MTNNYMLDCLTFLLLGDLLAVVCLQAKSVADLALKSNLIFSKQQYELLLS